MREQYLTWENIRQAGTLAGMCLDTTKNIIQVYETAAV